MKLNCIKMKISVVFVFLCFSMLCCVLPINGDKYDKIKINKDLLSYNTLNGDENSIATTRQPIRLNYNKTTKAAISKITTKSPSLNRMYNHSHLINYITYVYFYSDSNCCIPYCCSWPFLKFNINIKIIGSWYMFQLHTHNIFS